MKREEIVMKLKCDKCEVKSHASNKFFNDIFYCMKCGRNLGMFYERKATEGACAK